MENLRNCVVSNPEIKTGVCPLDWKSIFCTPRDSHWKYWSTSAKRLDYIGKEDYFMALAFLASQRSKDPETQVGACIVNQNDVVIGLGYNGFPTGVSDDEFPWTKKMSDPLQNKKYYVCHAELNAILNKNTADAKGCRLYVALFPCHECAKCIIQSGIKKVYYMSDKKAVKPSTKAAKKMFDAAGVTYEQFKPKRRQIVVDFGSMDGSP